MDATRGWAESGAVLLLCALWARGAVPAPMPPEAGAAEQLQAVLQAPADREHGRQLFITICAACHGAQGAGRPSGWPPAIAGQHRRVIAKELVDFRVGVRWYDPMERIAGPHVLHSLQDLADVSAYVSSLPPPASIASGSGQWIGRGATLYVGRCQSCHGMRGEGDDLQLVPRVANQQFEYLLRRLQDAMPGRSSNMQAQHRQLTAGLGTEELMGVADYMSRLGRPPN